MSLPLFLPPLPRGDKAKACGGIFRPPTLPREASMDKRARPFHDSRLAMISVATLLKIALAAASGVVVLYTL